MTNSPSKRRKDMEKLANSIVYRAVFLSFVSFIVLVGCQGNGNKKQSSEAEVVDSFKKKLLEVQKKAESKGWSFNKLKFNVEKTNSLTSPYLATLDFTAVREAAYLPAGRQEVPMVMSVAYQDDKWTTPTILHSPLEVPVDLGANQELIDMQLRIRKEVESLIKLLKDYFQ